MKGSSAKAMSPGKTGLGGVETTLNPLHDRDFRVEGVFWGVGWGGVVRFPLRRPLFSLFGP